MIEWLKKLYESEWICDLIDQFNSNFIVDNRWKLLVEGLTNTLLITAVALIIGIVIGVIVAAIRSTYDKNEESMKQRGGLGFWLLKIANAICKVYLTIIRGTPAVVQLMIFFFIIFATVQNGTVVAMIAFGINSGAYVAEIFRSGIMSVDSGQFEAGRSLGFNYVQTMTYIIVPQMFKAVLPTLCNEFIVLLKETSIAGYVGVRDLAKVGELIRSRTYSVLFALIAIALIYLAMVMLLTWLVGKLERRLRKSER